MSNFGGEIRPVSIGNTKICAELLKESLDADVFEIEMKAPYSDNYRECVAQAREDLQKNHLPELKTMPESIADYDVVILGYPNYCSTIPMPVATFLDAYDFSGKKILPFCTNVHQERMWKRDFLSMEAKPASRKSFWKTG